MRRDSTINNQHCVYQTIYMDPVKTGAGVRTYLRVDTDQCIGTVVELFLQRDDNALEMHI